MKVVGDDREVIIPTYDWTDFTTSLVPPPPPTSSMPGKVYVKENEHTLLKPGVIFDDNELPSVIHPAGLSDNGICTSKFGNFVIICPHSRPFSTIQQTEHPPTCTPPSSPFSTSAACMRKYAERDSGTWQEENLTPFKPFFFTKTANKQKNLLCTGCLTYNIIEIHVVLYYFMMTTFNF